MGCKPGCIRVFTMGCGKTGRVYITLKFVTWEVTGNRPSRPDGNAAPEGPVE
jgi:hypothetical protein